jgi:8-oxo-dGTP pyrophosphatase MutT (NUDIX family)
MQLSDLITPTTSAGTALFLRWNGYHVFSIPKRELWRSPAQVRFFGVGGKRQSSQETFVDCALRESNEEIGAVVSQIESAEQTHFLKADGSLEQIEVINECVRPRLILEKRTHSSYGSMTGLTQPYYLVAFNAHLFAKPKPSNEIAAILYLKDQHLSLMKPRDSFTIAELIGAGAQIEYQTGLALANSAILIPHGTAHFLIQH